MTKNAASQTITVRELTRNTTAGRFTYSIYKGKVVRRAFRRGRPSYEAAQPVTIRDSDNVKSVEYNVNSQLGRAFLGA
jgi:hypothetical protein